MLANEEQFGDAVRARIARNEALKIEFPDMDATWLDGFLDTDSGIWITDPTSSTCGRFQVADPLEEYGNEFYKWATRSYDCEWCSPSNKTPLLCGGCDYPTCLNCWPVHACSASL